MWRILVLGAGFAGLWSAVAAARRLDELGVGPGEVEVLVVNRTPLIRSASAIMKSISTRRSFRLPMCSTRSASSTS